MVYFLYSVEQKQSHNVRRNLTVKASETRIENHIQIITREKNTTSTWRSQTFLGGSSSELACRTWSYLDVWEEMGKDPYDQSKKKSQ